MRKVGTLAASVGGGAAVFAGGLVVGRATEVLARVDRDGLTWLSGWLQSAGFGGVAAIVAATIAFAAARQGARRQERADRKDQWWARAQWALDATLLESPENKRIGYEMLAALGSSEWAEEHESDVVGVATRRLMPTSSARNSGGGFRGSLPRSR